MGLTRKWYGLTLVVVGITSFPITGPTLGAVSLACGTVGTGIAIMLT